jgi:hypothetical protein
MQICGRGDEKPVRGEVLAVRSGTDSLTFPLHPLRFAVIQAQQQWQKH